MQSSFYASRTRTTFRLKGYRIETFISLSHLERCLKKGGRRHCGESYLRIPSFLDVMRSHEQYLDGATAWLCGCEQWHDRYGFAKLAYTSSHEGDARQRRYLESQITAACCLTLTLSALTRGASDINFLSGVTAASSMTSIDRHISEPCA